MNAHDKTQLIQKYKINFCKLCHLYIKLQRYVFKVHFINTSTFQRHFITLFSRNGLFVVDTVSLLTERLYSLIMGRTVNILPVSIWTASWPWSWNSGGELRYLIGATGRLIVTLVPYHPLFWQPDRVIVPNNCIICMPWWQTHLLRIGRSSKSCIYFRLLAFFSSSPHS